MNHTEPSMSEPLPRYLGTMQGALKFVLPFVLPVFSHFVLYSQFHIYSFFQLLTFHAPYHARMLQPLFLLCLPVVHKASSQIRYN